MCLALLVLTAAICWVFVSGWLFLDCVSHLTLVSHGSALGVGI